MSEELKTVRVVQNGETLKTFTCKYVKLLPTSIRFQDITPRLRKIDGGIDAYFSGDYNILDIDLNDRTAIITIPDSDIQLWINF